MPTELPARFEPAQVEDRIYRFWEEGRFFHTEPDRPGRSYAIVIPPPNVTGELHMGHALNNAIQDILIRWRRMQGCNTLWLPGTDHAGIGTQAVVERELAKEGRHRREVGREAFVERVWRWKDRYGNRIIEQLKRLGCSCDWERLRFTMDEGLSRAVLETFVRLHEMGLLYRGKYIVNWCPRCRTALSDLETRHEEHDGFLWHVRYPLEGAPDRFVTVATTRPETMLGDTAVAVHPQDERYAGLVGRTLTLPILGRRLPVIADEWVDRSFGTGAVKVTPAHDSNDFTLGRRHGLPEVVAIDEDGRMTLAAGAQYEGMDRFECREALVEDLRERGLLEKVEPHRHSVGHCDRCHTVVEPYLSDQWYVKVKPLAQKAIAAAREGRVRFHPARWKDFYLSWLEEARDWCVSRQIWWGHRLPVYYCDTCENTIIARQAPELCPACGGPVRQDEDVLDTWFSSALWPFSTLGWPDRTKELERYYPTDTLVTAREIIYFWVARMVMMGMEFMGREPFHDVYINSTILDEQGRRMSKSLGNGIDPIDMIERYGADAVRFSLITLATEDQDLKLSESRFEMGRNFANKVWNAGRFVLMNLASEGPAPGPQAGAPLPAPAFEDAWILSRLQAVTEGVTSLLEDLRLNDAAQMLYDFVWHEFCDWYVEIVKPRLQQGEPAARETLAAAFDRSLRLLHPFAPYLTEELWQSLKEQARAAGLQAARAMTAEALIIAPWPEGDPARRNEQAEAEMALLQEVIRAIRNVRKEKGIPDNRPLTVTVASPDEQTDRIVADRSAFFRQMAVLENLDHAVHAAKPRRCATTVVGTVEAFIHLEGLVDVAAERARLEKQKTDVERRVTSVEAALLNTAFLANAPDDVVEQRRQRAEELRAQLTKIIQNLADLD